MNFLSFTFDIKNNIILGMILNKSVLESFFDILNMVGRYFIEILAGPRIINPCLNSLGTTIKLYI
jgi:hypothetical protein